MPDPPTIRIGKPDSATIVAFADGRLVVIIKGKHAARKQYSSQEEAVAAGEEIYRNYVMDRWSKGEPTRAGGWLCTL